MAVRKERGKADTMDDYSAERLDGELAASMVCWRVDEMAASMDSSLVGV